jgi:hypothetical protein
MQAKQWSIKKLIAKHGDVLSGALKTDRYFLDS